MRFTREKERGTIMFLKQRQVGYPVVEGAVYQRTYGGTVTETATVLAVTRDGVGIPHVRFLVQTRRNNDVSEEQRTLSLSCFAELFQDQVSAA